MEAVRDDVFSKNSEIVVSFFTNRFYNEIYRVASEEFAKRGGRSRTNTYAQYLTTYLAELETSRDTRGVKMLDTVRALCSYYCKFAGETPLGEFVDCILGQIVPGEFYGSMGMGERDGMFCDVIKQVATGMGESALKPRMLQLIIDDRAHHQIGTNILHDVGMEIIRNFKASLISKLYSKSQGASSRRVVAAERYSSLVAVTKDIQCKLRDQELMSAKLARDNKALAIENAKLRARIAQLTQAPVAQVAQQPIMEPAKPRESHARVEKPREKSRDIPKIDEVTREKPRDAPKVTEKLADIPKVEEKLTEVRESEEVAREPETVDEFEIADEEKRASDEEESASDTEKRASDEESSSSDDSTPRIDIRGIAASIAARNRARK
jgi:regulator of replication initiation timing